MNLKKKTVRNKRYSWALYSSPTAITIVKAKESYPIRLLLSFSKIRMIKAPN
jgi:hypothetical protein